MQLALISASSGTISGIAVFALAIAEEVLVRQRDFAVGKALATCPM